MEYKPGDILKITRTWGAVEYCVVSDNGKWYGGTWAFDGELTWNGGEYRGESRVDFDSAESVDKVGEAPEWALFLLERMMQTMSGLRSRD